MTPITEPTAIEIPDSLTIGTYIYRKNPLGSEGENVARVPFCVMSIQGTIAETQSIDDGDSHHIDFSKTGWENSFSHCPTGEAIAYAKKIVIEQEASIKKHRAQLDDELLLAARREKRLRELSLWPLVQKR